jgi:hypothetical protein
MSTLLNTTVHRARPTSCTPPTRDNARPAEPGLKMKWQRKVLTAVQIVLRGVRALPWADVVPYGGRLAQKRRVPVRAVRVHERDTV